MCNCCNNNWPGLLNLFSANSGCGCRRCGNQCNSCGGNYDAYYAAQYALNTCGCNGAGTFNFFGASGGGVYQNGASSISASGCGCNSCNQCNQCNSCG